jgi:hypothetical protein
VSVNATDTAPVADEIVHTEQHANDGDGDSVAQYDFWNTGGGGGGWLLNNMPLTPGQDNFVNAALLSQVTYQAGASTDTIWMRASDGLQFGAWPQGVTVIVTGGYGQSDGRERARIAGRISVHRVEGECLAVRAGCAGYWG